MEAEGWYRDPYSAHDDRWFSMGRPTDLVRDGSVESHDQPPLGPWPTPLIEVPVKQSVAARGLRRADDDNEENDPSYSPASMIRRVIDDAAEITW